MLYYAMECDAMRCDAMRCNAMLSLQYNAMQCNAMQCNAMQCNHCKTTKTYQDLFSWFKIFYLVLRYFILFLEKKILIRKTKKNISCFKKIYVLFQEKKS